MIDFHKYAKIYILGHDENVDIFRDKTDEIQMQEKMDGGNFRFIIKNGNLVFGSRTQQLTSDEGDETNMNKQFKSAVASVRLCLKDKDLRLYEGNIFYLECMIKHTMDYDWEKMPAVLGFDVYNLANKAFIANANEIFKDLGIPFVPIIGTWKADMKVNDDLVPVSAYAPRSNLEQKAEGIVFKNFSKQIYAKYVRPQFREENAKTFGGTPKYQESGAGKICATYCTNSRIDKAIFYFHDQGEKIDMPLMRMIVGYVYKDIWEENWKTIIKKYGEINLREMRKIIIGRCRAVLQQVIVNNTR